jgi:hypothetical protein
MIKASAATRLASIGSPEYLRSVSRTVVVDAMHNPKPRYWPVSHAFGMNSHPLEATD